MDLKYFEEAYTSKYWIVRIYKVKKPENRDQIEQIMIENHQINQNIDKNYKYRNKI